MPLAEVAGLNVDLPDLLGQEAIWLADACGSALTAEAAVRVAVRSKTRLTSAFRDWVGVTARTYARIHRFSGTIGRLPGWSGTRSALAQECGYYDQPHVNAEFRALSGLAPREFLASLRYPDSVSLAE